VHWLQMQMAEHVVRGVAYCPHVIDRYSLWAEVCLLPAQWPRNGGRVPALYGVGCERAYLQ